MFRRAITFCAAFFALFALAATAHAADPTFIPPWAGTGIPVILSLAKNSACKDAARMISAGKSESAPGIRGALTRIQNNLFPWRLEVTNGYQEGFFYYALLGYASEQSGDIPFAYRCYQNALLCINEEKTFSCQEPTAEIYLGLGRTCLAAGRYMDAKDWLDTAYLEAGDNTNIQAAVDRVLIQRGNELGDYAEIIFLYQHLMSIADLEKGEYANYAQILFWSHQDRPGFSKLLEGISKLGIDNNLGVKDPLVNSFLNNIMRADDDEVKYFYDLLGWSIVDARALKGDEEYLAFLCNARTLFCRVYDFLEPENDLEKVKKRIDVVKKQLAEGYDVFGSGGVSSQHPRDKGVRFRVSVKKKRKSKTALFSESGAVESTPETCLDDLLMTADCKMKAKDYQGAKMFYEGALESATGAFANLEYDGTTAKTAAVIGLLKINPQFYHALRGRNPQFNDGSMRAAQVILQLHQLATNDTQRAQYDTESAIATLPQANAIVLSYLKKQCVDSFRADSFERGFTLYEEYRKRKSTLSRSTYCILIDLLFSKCKTGEAFKMLSSCLNNVDGTLEQKKNLVDFWVRNHSLASEDDLRVFANVGLKLVLKNSITCYEVYHIIFGKVLSWKKFWYPIEQDLRQNVRSGNWKAVHEILSSKLVHSSQAGHLTLKSRAYAAQGNTNEAYRIMRQAYKKLCKTRLSFILTTFEYPTEQTLYLSDYVKDCSADIESNHYEWLIALKEKNLKLKRDKCVTNLDRDLKSFARSLGGRIGQ